MNAHDPSPEVRIDALERRLLGLHRSLLLGTFVVGLAVTAAIAYQARRVSAAREEEARADVALGIVRPMLDSTRREISDLAAFARFVELTRPLSREAFHAFAERVEAPYLEVDWVERVDLVGLAQTEALLSDYAGRPIQVEPSPTAVGRGHAFVRFFGSPPTLEGEGIGVDLLADPAHAELLARVERTQAMEVWVDPSPHAGDSATHRVEIAAPVLERTSAGRLRGVVLLAYDPRVGFDAARMARATPGARLTVDLRSDGRIERLFASAPEDGVHRQPLVERSVRFDAGTIEVVLASLPPRTRLRDRFDPGVALAGSVFIMLATALLASRLAVRRREERIASERVAVESALAAEQAERARWQSALASAGDGVWDWDVRNERVFFSSTWKRMLGFDDDEIGDELREWSDRVHPDDLPRAMAALEAHFRGETDAYECVHRMRCKDGGYKWILDRGRVIEWIADGRPARVIGTHADVDRLKRLEDSLRRANANLEGVLRAGVGVSIITTDAVGTITGFNVGAEKLLGYRADEVVGELTPEVFHDAAEIRSRSDEIFAATGRRCVGFEVFVAHTATEELDVRVWRYLRKDGDVRMVRLAVSAMRDDEGAPLGYVGMAMDVTHELEQAREIERGAERLKKLSENVPGAIYQYLRHPDGRASFPFASEGLVDVYEITPAEAAVDAEPIMRRLHPEDRDAVDASIERSAAELVPWVKEYRVILPRAGVRWLRGEAQPERLPDGSTLWHGYISDITELKLLQLELLDHATHDALTRALNRRHLDRSLGEEIAASRVADTRTSVVMLDIDDFKKINDAHGHDVGDRVLVAIVEALQDSVRSTDRVYRTGGEELLVVCPSTGLDGARRVALTLLERVRRVSVGPVASLTASFGVAEARADDSVASLLKRADLCVYEAKAAGKDRVFVESDLPVAGAAPSA